jgi:hypothetical protein
VVAQRRRIHSFGGGQQSPGVCFPLGLDFFHVLGNEFRQSHFKFIFLEVLSSPTKRLNQIAALICPAEAEKRFNQH